MVAMGCGVGAGLAQELVAPLPEDDLPILPSPEERRAAVEGIVVDIFNVKKPWQLVNPAAPKEYGDGRTNRTVSYSEEFPGKPKGFIVLAVEY